MSPLNSVVTNRKERTWLAVSPIVVAEFTAIWSPVSVVRSQLWGKQRRNAFKKVADEQLRNNAVDFPMSCFVWQSIPKMHREAYKVGYAGDELYCNGCGNLRCANRVLSLPTVASNKFPWSNQVWPSITVNGIVTKWSVLGKCLWARCGGNNVIVRQLLTGESHDYGPNVRRSLIDAPASVVWRLVMR